jgi:4-amino-4-deoxy-L-arabinose transferase-like glycosyltransferase
MSQTRIWGRINSRKMEYLVLGLIVLLGTILRLYQLDLIPVGLSGDEGADGLGARRILSGEELPLFITEDFGEEPMHTYLVALSFALWGVRLWAIRFVSAAIGIITIPLIFLLAKELLPQRGRAASLVPLLSAFFLATSYWHIIYSRAGMEVVALPFFSSALVLFLCRGIRTQRRWHFFVSGLILGASLYSYRGARFLPILLTLFFGGWVVVSRRFRRDHLVNLVLVALVAAIACAPLGVYAITYPEIFFAREMHVSVFNPGWGRGSPLQAFGVALFKTAGMFNFQGDPEFDRNPGRRPVLDPVSSLCFLVGMGIALWRWRRTNYLFTVVWFVVMSLPGAFTAEALPHFHRGIGAVPPLCLLCALGATWVKQRLETAIPWSGARAASWAVLGLILISSTVFSYRDYFAPWQRRLDEGQIIGRGFMEAAELMNTTRITDGVWILPASSLRPRNLPYYEVSFLYHGPEPEHTLNIDEETTPGELSAITSGYRQPAVINWKEFVLEEAYLSLNSDPKGLLDFLFKKYGRLIRTEPHESFDLMVYEVPDATEFSIAQSLDPVSLDFGGELRLEGVTYGGSSPRTTSTPEEVDQSILPSGKDAWVVLQWQAIKNLDKNYKVAVYLLDGRGRVVGQADRLLLSNHLQPTSGWEAGQVEIDYYTLPSAPATAPGKYTIEVAAYDAESMERLDVFDPEARVTKSSLSVGELQLVRAATPAQVKPLEEVSPASRDVAPGLQLLGYDMPIRLAGPGETVSIALYWRATEDLSQDYLFSLQLTDEDGHIWLQQESRPADGAYPTTEWNEGEVIKDWHDVMLPPDAPQGRHQVSLQIIERGEALGESSLGHLDIQGRPRLFGAPEVGYPLEARIGEGVLFLGYDLQSDELRPGDTLNLTLYWQAVQEMQVSYTVFTHLLDDEERIWGQTDSAPLTGEAPTTGWVSGEFIADTYEIILDPEAPSGDYVIEIGMYDATTGLRLPIFASGQQLEGDRIVFGRILVTP